MAQTMTLGKRLAIGFTILTIVLLLVGITGLLAVWQISKSLHNLTTRSLPLTDVFILRAQYPRVLAGECALLSIDASDEVKAQQYKRFELAKEEFAKAFELIEKVQLTPEQDQAYKEFRPLHDAWWKNHEVFVQYAKEFEQFDLYNPAELQRDIRQFIGDHLRLCSAIRHYIITGTGFEGGEDHTSCNFGKWLTTFKSKNPEIQATIEQLKEPHQQFHAGIKAMKSALAQGEKEKAIALLNDDAEILKKTFSGFDHLLAIADKAFLAYKKMSDQALRVNVESYNPARDALQRFVDTVKADNHQMTESISGTLRYTIILVTLGLIIGVIVAIAISAVLTRSLSRLLTSISSRIREGAVQVTSASGQVAQASQSLASSASEQASSNEETSASLEELTSMIQQNAANSSQAEQMMKEAREIVEESVNSMNLLMSEMAQLRQASANTAGIIKTIDEIAFQTNLLALNAAVEAARAGEAGKGFAVVAEEVRRLAQRSAEAAKNTQRMLEEAIQRSEQSANKSQYVAQQLEKVKESAEKMFTLIQEISTASNEQAKGVEQINIAMMEINKTTQEVAANSEQSASASEQLSAQAHELLSLVQELENLVGGNSKGLSNGNNPTSESPMLYTRSTSAITTDRRKPKRGQIPALATANSDDKSVVSPEQVIPLSEDELSNF
ncbi:MAG: methyl-accepting chemotaxis protein [Candidatus Methanomethylicaceae archaeon]